MAVSLVPLQKIFQELCNEAHRNKYVTNRFAPSSKNKSCRIGDVGCGNIEQSKWGWSALTGTQSGIECNVYVFYNSYCHYKQYIMFVSGTLS